MDDALEAALAADAAAPLAVGEIAAGPLATLRLFHPDAEAVGAAAGALGIALAAPHAGAAARGARALRLGPGEWLIRGGAPAAAMSARLEGVFHHLAELGPSRTVWRIEGALAAELLQCGSSLDLDPIVFGPSSAARTLLAQVVVVIERPGPGPALEVIAERAHRAYLGAWLQDALTGFPEAAPR